MKEENKERPKYTDPKEWAIIRSIYFNDHRSSREEISWEEYDERMTSKNKQKNNAR